MLKKIGEPAPPKGLKLILFRAPLYLYRWKLGVLLGERFIRLQHLGRKSGQPRETVLEVIGRDRKGGKIFCASGFGDKSQWFRNICANNAVVVTLGNQQSQATARVLSAAQARDVLLSYAQAHPKSIRGVARLSGYEMDGTEQDVLEFSQLIKIVEFTLD